MDQQSAYMTTWLGQQSQLQLLSNSISHHSALPQRMDIAADVYCQQPEYTKEEPVSIYDQDCGADKEDSLLREGSRSHSTPLTLKWLNDNYEIADCVCIPRSTLYQHYLDFSEKADIIPVNAASFGKIIRQQFPQITTRRLGTRGQSKYHYYGIGVKDSSPYYDFVYSKAGQQSVNSGKKEISKQVVVPYSPRSRIGTLLPDFPSISELKLPDDVSEEKVLTFVMMYRTHCQRILDTVIRANFDEVQNFLLHFWQGMPPHMVPILGLQPIVGLIAVCDCILYRTISNVLTPNVLQALPESLTQIIRRFAKQLRGWMHSALVNLPESLQATKFKIARQFSKILTLQVSLNHLCQASRTVMQSSDILVQMLEDWRNVDKASISKQTLYMLGDIQPPHMDKELERMLEFYNEFELLLQGQCQIEAYIHWLDRMIDVCVIKPGLEQPGNKRRISRNFLLVWSCFGTRIIRDMTLHSSPSFGSFHLLHLMFDDYILYQMELLHCQDMADSLMCQIRGEFVADFKDELSLPLEARTNFRLIATNSHAADYNGQFVNGPHGGPYDDTPDSIIDQKPICLQRHASSRMVPLEFSNSSALNQSTFESDKVQHAPYYRCPSSQQQPSDVIHNWRVATAAAAANAQPQTPPALMMPHYHPCYQAPSMMPMAQSYVPYPHAGMQHYPLDLGSSSSSAAMLNGCAAGYQPYVSGGGGSDYCQSKAMKRAAERGGSDGTVAPLGMDGHHHQYPSKQRFHQPTEGATSGFVFMDNAQAAYAMT